jgi:DNA-binding response OmpR family regulator
VLLVESDRRLGEAIAQQLIADGYRVEFARTSRHARILATGCRPKLALIGSLDSPRGGLALLEEIRSGSESDAVWQPDLPAVMIGSSRGELDAVRAFDAGADDFVPMPVGYLELRARMRAVLRRAEHSPHPAGLIVVGSLRVDPVRRVASLNGSNLELRRMEYELLRHLAAEPRRVFSRVDLLQAIWGYRSAGSTRTIDSHASRLRRKLTAAEPRPWLVSVWGVGYRLI